MRQEFDQYKDEMADVAESLEMAALDKEMAEEKVSDYEYVHVRLCVCVCVHIHIYVSASLQVFIYSCRISCKHHEQIHPYILHHSLPLRFKGIGFHA